MKKIMYIALAVCSVFTGLHAESEKISYFVKVESGSAEIVRKVYIESQKDFREVKTPNDGKIVFYWEDTTEGSTAIFAKLRKVGHIKNTANPTSFTIVVIEDGNTLLLFTVDSSKFKNLPVELLKIQDVFGKSVSGGEKDQIQVTKASLLVAQKKLEEAGFECKIEGLNISLRERRYSHTFTCHPSLKDLVKTELQQHTNEIKVVGNNAFEVQLTNSQFAAMQKHLLSTGHVSKISKNANGITSIEAIPLKKFKVKVVLNNQFEYDKIVPEISKLKFKVTDKEMRESGFGICIAIFDVTVKKASASDIKAGVWRAVRSVCPNVKHHSISVESVAN